MTVRWLLKVFARVIAKGHRQITFLRSLPILSQALILILGTTMIPLTLALSLPILLTLVFAITPGIILGIRWFDMFISDDDDIGDGDMKVPTFYASDSAQTSGHYEDALAVIFCMPVIGVVFGGILHFVGRFFDFPSSAEAMLWRVSSAVLTGIAFLFPIFFAFGAFSISVSNSSRLLKYSTIVFLSIVILVYVVSHLLLLVEAFISLRHLTPGMFALVKWTSFIPHI